MTVKERYKKEKKTYITFVDVEKVFDNIKQDKLFDILEKIGIRFRQRRVVLNPYKGQKLTIRSKGKEEEAKIGKDVDKVAHYLQP